MPDISTWEPAAVFAVVLVAVAASVFVVSAIASLVVRAVARKRDWAGILIRRARWPFRTVLLLAGLWIAIAVAFPAESWRPAFDHAMLIALIAAGAWLSAQILLFLAALVRAGFLPLHHAHIPASLARRDRAPTFKPGAKASEQAREEVPDDQHQQEDDRDREDDQEHERQRKQQHEDRRDSQQRVRLLHDDCSHARELCARLSEGVAEGVGVG